MTDNWFETIERSIQQRNTVEMAPFAVLISNYDCSRKLVAVQTKVIKELRDKERQIPELQQRVKYLEMNGSVVLQKKLEDQLSESQKENKKLTEQLCKSLDSYERNVKLEAENSILKKTNSEVKERHSMVEASYSVMRSELEAAKTMLEKQKEILIKLQVERDEAKSDVHKLGVKLVECQDAKNGIEQQYNDLRRLGGAALQQQIQQNPPSGIGRGSREPFDKLLDQPRIGCIAPSYIAFQNEGIHEGDVHSVTMVETGKHIWTSSSDKWLKCWESTGGQFVNRVPSITAVLCLDSSASLLVGGSVDATCRVWELSTLRLLFQLTGHQEKVTASYFSPDSQRVVSSSTDRTIKVWDLSRQSLVHTTLCPSGCHDVSMSNDRIVSAHSDGALRLWDSRTYKECGELKAVHEKQITCVRWTADGHYIVSLGKDNIISVTDGRTMRVQCSTNTAPLVVSSSMSRFGLSPDGTMIAVGSHSNLLVFSAQNLAKEPKVLSNGHSGVVTVAVWSPDGYGVSTIGTDKKLVFWR